MGLVTWLSSKPGSYFPTVEMPEADKIVHIVLFATGAFFASGAMLVSISLPRKVTFGLTVAVISVFGMLDEYHQLFTPGRSGGDVGDWAADTVGAFCGVLLIDWIVRTSAVISGSLAYSYDIRSDDTTRTPDSPRRNNMAFRTRTS